MKNLVLPCRYVCFASIIVCNALMCGGASWNLGIVKSLGLSVSVDGYVIFLSALALVFVSSMMVVELLHQNAVTSRVWFECAWIGLFLILEFCGAVSLTIFGSGLLCMFRQAEVTSDAHPSIALLLGSSWTCVLILFVYFMVLTISGCTRFWQDPAVWNANVRHYQWQNLSTTLAGKQKGSTLPRVLSLAAPSIKAPQPLRPAPAALYAHRTSRGSSHQHARQRSDPGAAAPQSKNMSQIPAPIVPSLYPQHLQMYTSTRPTVGLPSQRSPPLLGDWPRSDIINEPVNKKRRAAPPVPTAVPQPAPSSTSQQQPVAEPQAPPRPLGTANKRRDLRDRVVVPPPLDLSKINSGSSKRRR